MSQTSNLTTLKFVTSRKYFAGQGTKSLSSLESSFCSLNSWDYISYVNITRIEFKNDSNFSFHMWRLNTLSILEMLFWLKCIFCENIESTTAVWIFEMGKSFVLWHGVYNNINFTHFKWILIRKKYVSSHTFKNVYTKS